MLSSEDLILGLCFFIEFSKYLLYIASNEMQKDIGNFLLIGIIWRIIDFNTEVCISTKLTTNNALLNIVISEHKHKFIWKRLFLQM